MKILIACEESQTVCNAFRELGYEAYSCDIEPCSGGHPEWHIQGNVLDIIGIGDKTILLQNGESIFIQNWDLMIAHPPCTYLTRAATRWLYPNHKLNKERYNKGLKAKEFFMKLLNADIPMIAIENPVPHKVFKMTKETQIIQPFYFGHKAQKTTLLWLKNLPKLTSTNTLFKHTPPEFMRDSKGIRHSKWFMDCGYDSKLKSKTFKGIAKAMAEQWNNPIIKQHQNNENGEANENKSSPLKTPEVTSFHSG